jgi:hypothetical protein
MGLTKARGKSLDFYKKEDPALFSWRGVFWIQLLSTFDTVVKRWLAISTGLA